MAGYVDCSKISDTSPSTAGGGLGSQSRHHQHRRSMRGGAVYAEKFEELVTEFLSAVRARRARTELEARLAEVSAAGSRAAGRGLKPLLQRVDLATA
ncbi:hypothetical protein HK405_011318 [Cladochytrium tenue]|nr:hypothetical protein HK405_011318 [Cladochytrium tenue]